MATLVSVPELAAAASSESKLRATGRAVGSGVATIVCWGTSSCSLPEKDIMVVLYRFPQTAPIVDASLIRGVDFQSKGILYTCNE